jgi:hypothetical protein
METSIRRHASRFLEDDLVGLTGVTERMAWLVI